MYGTSDSGGAPEAAAGEPTPKRLFERAAAPNLRRIDLDLERLPEP